MHISHFCDKRKQLPEGSGVAIEGRYIRRQRGMIFWYRWGAHTFDVRIIRRLLGISEEQVEDKYFMPGNEYEGNPGLALVHMIERINTARGKQKFKDLMRRHDEVLRQEANI